MSAPGGGCLLPGRGLHPGVSAPREGGCLVENPGKAIAAGGTHPTGMHSCCKIRILTNIQYNHAGMVRTLGVVQETQDLHCKNLFVEFV